MRSEILKMLTEINDEERTERSGDPAEQKNRYSRSGRFIIERRHMSSIVMGESTAAICIRPHPRFHKFPSHSHDYIEIMYVCSGSVTHVIGGEPVRIDKDRLIIFGKDTSHSILAAGDEDLGINLIISTDLFESMCHRVKADCQNSDDRIEGLLSKGGTEYLVFSAEDSIEIQNIMESMIWSSICKKDGTPHLLIRSTELLLSYLYELSADDSRHKSEKSGYKERTKQKILDYIKTSYSTATLTEAAEMLGLSPSYLSRLICEYFGVSFKDLLMETRFETACYLLSYTDAPIGDIINRVGYENSSYFHKEFKRRYGETPNNYRKKH